jgi:hypothetical protein
MEAGAAHGVANGTEFIVYQDPEFPPRNAPLGTLVVRDISAFSSTLDVPLGSTRFALAQPSYALQSNAGAAEGLRLHMARDETLARVFEAFVQKLQLASPTHTNIVLVDKEQAELAIEIEDSHVIFNILNPFVTKFGLVRLPFQITPNIDDVYPVICAAVHYHWHLHRTNKKAHLQNRVRIEFMKLKQDDEDFDEDFNLILRPDGPNLNIGGVVDIVVDEDAIYGINIINDTALALYPSLFFFDNSDFSISECFAFTTE